LKSGSPRPIDPICRYVDLDIVAWEENIAAAPKTDYGQRLGDFSVEHAAGLFPNGLAAEWR